MGVTEALPDSSSSASPPAANMPLPVISFHLGAEHCFLRRKTEINSSLSALHREMKEKQTSV
jgi:hypothetical protein